MSEGHWGSVWVFVIITNLLGCMGNVYIFIGSGRPACAALAVGCGLLTLIGGMCYTRSSVPGR